MDQGDEIACVSSTQVGKTWTYACKLAARLWTAPNRHRPWWWCAPTYKQSRVGQSYLYQICSSAGIMASGPRPPFKSNPPPPLVLINGNSAEFRTWDDPAHLMGDPIDGAVIDEGGMISPYAHSAISSRRSYTLGPLWWIGNPGVTTGPFRKVCERQKRAGRLHRWNWRTMHGWLVETDPAKAAKYEAFIEQERESLPGFEFRRLYEAEWTEDEAAVFRGLSAAVQNGPLLAPEADDFVLGVDVGQVVDYLAVASMGRKSRRIELRDRYRGVSFPDAALRIQRLQAELGGAPVVLEVNNQGAALRQEFDRLGVSYVPFTTTNQSKQELILSLAAEIQGQRCTVGDFEPMPYELSIYRYERTPSGLYRYGAPAGEHDDTVMAAALARWGVGRAVSLSDYGWVA